MTKRAESKKILVGKNILGYATSNVYRSSVKKVWEAATQSKHLKRHFVDDMRGEFGPGLEPVTWNWKAWGDWTFRPIKFVKEKEIVFLAPDWENKYFITVRFEFLRKDGKTIFRVHENGYSAKHLQRAFMQCEGWTEFHTGIKAYLKWGGNLRKL